MSTLPRQLFAALRAMIVFSIVLGLIYPLAVLGVGQLLFNGNAEGSLIRSHGAVVGSDLIGQAFTDPNTGAVLPRYFQSRPSNAGDGYDPTGTAASNRGPEDVVDAPDRPSLLTLICGRSEQIGDDDGVSGARPYCSGDTGAPAQRGRVSRVDVPADAVTASGSGLDPHISPAYAALQVSRVAKARGISEATVRDLVEAHTQGRTLGFLGEPRVNVLQLNIALDVAR